MNPAEIAKLSSMWAAYAAYYRVKLDDDVLRMYADDLADLDFKLVSEALAAFRRDPKNKFMPLPAQIRELIEPQVDPDSASREIAARISAAIPMFGYNNPERARDYIGEVGWAVVRKQGGWTYICEHHGDDIDPTAFQAQVRELAKSTLIHDPEAMDRAVNALPEPKRNILEIPSAKEIMSSTFNQIQNAMERVRK